MAAMNTVLDLVIGTQAGLAAGFVLTALLVVAAGIRLSIYGDALGERTGLGNGLVGLIFLAAVTSLPELVVSLTSVIQTINLHHGADLAAGNMLGSNIFNLLILAFLVLIMGHKFKPSQLESTHTDSTLCGLIMLLLFGGAFLYARHMPGIIPLLHCSPLTLLLPITYSIFIYREHKQLKQQSECNENVGETLPSEQKLLSLSAHRFYGILILLSLCIVGGGISLSILGGRMALPPEQGGFGLEASLIGTLFLAISTSLPELVISFASVRLGFLDMAVGNVLGSNMFNLLIIFAADLAMRGKSLLSQASPKNGLSAVMILLLTILAAALLRSKKRVTASAIAAGMLIAYIITLRFLT